jgi:hypothetical protein
MVTFDGWKVPVEIDMYFDDIDSPDVYIQGPDRLVVTVEADWKRANDDD